MKCLAVIQFWSLGKKNQLSSQVIIGMDISEKKNLNLRIKNNLLCIFIFVPPRNIRLYLRAIFFCFPSGDLGVLWCMPSVYRAWVFRDRPVP